MPEEHTHIYRYIRKVSCCRLEKDYKVVNTKFVIGRFSCCIKRPGFQNTCCLIWQFGAWFVLRFHCRLNTLIHIENFTYVIFFNFIPIYCHTFWLGTCHHLMSIPSMHARYCIEYTFNKYTELHLHCFIPIHKFIDGHQCQGFNGKSGDYLEDTHPVLKSIRPLAAKLNKNEAQTKMAAIILKGSSIVQSQDYQQHTHPVLHESSCICILAQNKQVYNK